MSSSSEELLLGMPDFSSDEESGSVLCDDAAEWSMPQRSSRLYQEVYQSLQKEHKEALQLLSTSAEHIHTDRDLACNSWQVDPLTATAKTPTLFHCFHHHHNASNADNVPSDPCRECIQRFTKQHIAQRRPALLPHLAQEGKWRACSRWKDAEAIREWYGKLPVKITEMRDLSGCRSVLFNDFCVPAYFREDLYSTSEKSRMYFNNYRYFVMGGDRSGTDIHTDPKFTDAWNTLMCGKKRWCLFSPVDKETDAFRRFLGVHSAPDPAVTTTSEPPRGCCKRPAAYWWMDHYPRLRALAAQNGGYAQFENPESGEQLLVEMLEVEQLPGDTIYVPYGWYHVVLNIGITVAITQNFLPPVRTESSFQLLRKSDPEFAQDFAWDLNMHCPAVVRSCGAVRDFVDTLKLQLQREMDR